MPEQSAGSKQDSVSRSNESKSGLKSLALHFHPPRVPQAVLNLSHTWGLGGMALVLIVVQLLTGLLLRFVYAPFPGKAYDSMLVLQKDVLFGPFIRNIHHWSAIFLVSITFLHLLRVFFTGAFQQSRKFNWILGCCLLVLVIASNFTGYLLPWDQLAYWAITVSTGMLEYLPVIGSQLREAVLGGTEVGSATLLIFYNLHTNILPMLLFFLMALHFWQIRKAHGVIVPLKNGNEAANYVSVIPNLVVREMAVALVLLAVIFTLSAILNAPLQVQANPDFSPNPAKAPWYFQGFQELLLHFHPVFAVLIIPIMVILAMLVLPYLHYDSEPNGIWFISDKGRKMGLISAIIALLLTPIAILLDDFIINPSLTLAIIPGFILKGIVPLGSLLIFITALYQFLKRKFIATRNETVQAIFIFILVGFLILMITSVSFRGEGMHLTWPWKI
jgi:quinol-cytochrome oxidoreductase complex cytochrome b subunit